MKIKCRVQSENVNKFAKVHWNILKLVVLRLNGPFVFFQSRVGDQFTEKKLCKGKERKRVGRIVD